MRFKGKVVIVTGGNSGIGRVTAEQFARQGATVIVAARNAQRAEAIVQAIQQENGSARFLPVDVRRAEQCQRVVDDTLASFKRLDVLVNNAGVIFRNRNVLQTSVAEWDEAFDVNIKGVFYMSKSALPHLIESRGSIVNVASYLGLVGAAGLAAYCASKGALVQLTRAMALDHATDGVRVNCVCPGSVHTPMIESAWEMYGGNAAHVWAAKHPLGRIARPEEVAGAILHLAGEEASFITGVALPVDGGITAG